MKPEELLYLEAELLDEGRFQDWLELLAPTLRYWAPVRADLPRDLELAGEALRLPLFDEDKPSLLLRVRRLGTGLAWCEHPPTRSRRLIGNIRAAELGDGYWRLRSNFIVCKNRSEADDSLLSGTRDDRWHCDLEGRWLLHERRILVDQRRVENLTLFL